MRRLHPAEIGLVVLTIVPLAVLSELLAATRRNTGMSWSGEPSQEQILAMALSQLAFLLGPVLGTVSGAAALGLVFVWCLAPSRQRSTRTMSAAGSTRNRAAKIMPNSSPSISNSSGSPSISMSTERPRE
jgi:hypothetical protein